MYLFVICACAHLYVHTQFNYTDTLVLVCLSRKTLALRGKVAT